MQTFEEQVDIIYKQLKLSILHLAPRIGKESFGIGPIVLDLAANQQLLGHRTHIWSCDPQNKSIQLENSHELKINTIHSYQIKGPNRLAYSPSMERAILEKAFEFDIIHRHGLWTGVSRAVTKWHDRTHRPFVLTPQGMLEPWALNRSTWRKRLALLLYEYRNLHNANCMHALSIQEAKNFRSFGLRNPIAVIPNGISDGWLQMKGHAEEFRRKNNIPEETRIILFLGRITPKKGLPMFLRALSTIKQQLINWKLVIAGVDEFNHQKELNSIIEQFSLDEYVQFVGPQFGQDKRNAFAAADIFVLPSHSEGAPIAILEALGAGVPVLTTKASPWEDLVTYHCGWWTEILEKSITEALDQATHNSSETLCEMGLRGKALVKEKYTWSHISTKMLLLYEWLLGHERTPGFVLKD